MPTYVSLPAGGLVSVMSQTFNSSGITISFAANSYKKIEVNMDLSGGFINTITLTGLTAATYYQNELLATGAVPTSAGATAQNSWSYPGTSGISSMAMVFNLFPAPAKKALFIQAMSVTNMNVSMAAHSTDTTNDPTAIALAFDATRTGFIYVAGYV